MVETLAYDVEKKDGDFEVRRYGGHILAHVDIKAPFDEAMNMGFRVLANYIFGGNKKRSSIEMTAPVEEEKRKSEKIPITAPVTEESLKESEKIKMTTPVTEEKTGNIHRISFVMPSKYTMEALPEPEDERIKIEEMKKWLKENSIQPMSNFVVAQYNHPAVPGFFRRNEIMVEI
ncbi:MAG: heme-binding protein [Methanobacterium sp.]|nr:heme-binding protein [Methanobacterium sp.]